MSNDDINNQKTPIELRREKFENTSVVAAAMVAADRMARAAKNARLRAAREAVEPISKPLEKELRKDAL